VTLTRVDLGGVSAPRGTDSHAQHNALAQRSDDEMWAYAINRLMIPMTRSIGHLIVHIYNLQSDFGQILKKVSERSPGSIEWIGSGAS